jgi:hypothetical protein
MLRDKRGAHEIPLIVIFGVLLSFLLMLVFVGIYTHQTRAWVEEEAGNLLDQLSQAVFQSYVYGTESRLRLPDVLGDSPYLVEVTDNSSFVIRVLDARFPDLEFRVILPFLLIADSDRFHPGSFIYFGRVGDRVKISENPVKPEFPELPEPLATPPPEFYDFAKNHPKEAVAVASAFFTMRDSIGTDIIGYAKRENRVIVRFEGGELAEVDFLVDNRRVGHVKRALVVSEVELVNGETGGLSTCPSIENAWMGGWFYSPEMVIAHLASRTWKNENGSIVLVPADAGMSLAVIETDLFLLPAWRVEFQEYVIYYRAMPWWELENEPGFLFQSYPYLYPSA